MVSRKVAQGHLLSTLAPYAALLFEIGSSMKLVLLLLLVLVVVLLLIMELPGQHMTLG
jgi:hypothetical protein